MLDITNRDFTIFKFQQLCEAIADNYPTLTMAEYMESQCPDIFILMRHDVDRMPGHALETAKIEHDLGIKATYYFRSINSVFKPEIIEQILSMGHEIGYHYETLSESNGDPNKAIDLFKSHLSEFEKICKIRTICMHGRPLSKYDNRDLWKTHDFKNFGIIGEAYLSVNDDLNYFSDTGRSWSEKNSLRDFIPGQTQSLVADVTDDLIDLIKKAEANNFYILTHPERWSQNALDWCSYYGMDMTVNVVKNVLKAVRK